MQVRSKGMPITAVFDEIQASKNASMFALILAAICPYRTRIAGFDERIADVECCLSALRSIRPESHQAGAGAIEVPAGAPSWQLLSTRGLGSIRHSLLLMPHMARAVGKVSFPLPGGCKINGSRPFDFHIDLWSAFGVQAEVSDSSRITLTCVAIERPGPVRFALPFPSVGATATALLMSASTGSELILSGAAVEPEVSWLIEALRELGCQVDVEGRELRVARAWDTDGSLELIPDRLVVATALIATAMTRGRCTVPASGIDFLNAEISLLSSLGCRTTNEDERFILDAGDVEYNQGFQYSADTYPALSTDCQPLFAALATSLQGPSYVTDLVYPSRFEYAECFRALGAGVELRKRTCTIRGAKQLGSGAFSIADIRSNMAAALAGLRSDVGVWIERPEQLRRGYADPVALLSQFGLVSA